MLNISSYTNGVNDEWTILLNQCTTFTPTSKNIMKWIVRDRWAENRIMSSSKYDILCTYDTTYMMHHVKVELESTENLVEMVTKWFSIFSAYFVYQQSVPVLAWLITNKCTLQTDASYISNTITTRKEMTVCPKQWQNQ